MCTIVFNELKYYAFGDAAKKKLENRDVIIHKNLGLGSKRFVIKYENIEKLFYITFDYKTLDDKDGQIIFEKYRENLKNLVSYFDNNIIHVYGIIYDKKVYFHTIYMNNNFFDYEDSKSILECFNFDTDQILYSGKYDEDVLKEFVKLFGTVSLIPKDQLIEEKVDPDFYIVKFDKIVDEETKNFYKEIVEKFIKDRIENETGIEIIKAQLDKSRIFNVTKDNEAFVKTMLILPFIYEAHRIELMSLVRDNKLVLTVFDKILRTEVCRIIDTYFKKV